MHRYRLQILCLVCLLSGCAAELTDGGRSVRQIPSAQKGECKFIGVVEGSEGNGWDIQDDRRGAINRIRNEVAKVRGNAFVIVDGSSGVVRTFIQADAYRCPE